MAQEIEQKYNFKDLLYFVFAKWRKILLWILLGAIVLGIFTIVSSKGNISSSKAKDPSSVEQEWIKEFVMKNNPEILRLTSEIKQFQDVNTQLNNKLATDPFLSKEDNTEYISSFDLKIELLEENASSEIILERTRQLALEYIRNFKDLSFSTYIYTNTNAKIPEDKVKDMMEMSLDENNIIQVRMRAPDENLLNEFVHFFQEYLERDAGSQLVFPYAHTIKVLNEKITSQDNPKIGEKRKELENETDKIHNTLIIKNNELTETTQKVIEQANKDYIARHHSEDSNFKTVLSYSTLLRNMVIGAIVFAALACLFIFFRISSKDIFTDSSLLAQQLGLTYLGEVIHSSEPSAKNRFGSRLDTFIYRKYISNKISTSNNSIIDADYLATYIMNFYKKKEGSNLDIRKLNFIGDPEKNVNLLCNKLEDKLADKDFDLIKINLPINKKEILTDLNKSASSVLVLRPRKTKLTDLIRAVELCNQFEINIIGIVSLESL